MTNDKEYVYHLVSYQKFLILYMGAQNDQQKLTETRLDGINGDPT